MRVDEPDWRIGAFLVMRGSCRFHMVVAFPLLIVQAGFYLVVHFVTLIV